MNLWASVRGFPRKPDAIACRLVCETGRPGADNVIIHRQTASVSSIVTVVVRETIQKSAVHEREQASDRIRIGNIRTESPQQQSCQGTSKKADGPDLSECVAARELLEDGETGENRSRRTLLRQTGRPGAARATSGWGGRARTAGTGTEVAVCVGRHRVLSAGRTTPAKTSIDIRRGPKTPPLLDRGSAGRAGFVKVVAIGAEGFSLRLENPGVLAVFRILSPAGDYFATEPTGWTPRRVRRFSSIRGSYGR